MQMKRVNVAVTASIDVDGIIVPHKIFWRDGREWEIKRVLHTCRSADGDFVGTRYTILIGETERYLYRDYTIWYVLLPEEEVERCGNAG